MDYEGNYFPDEEESSQSKGKTVRKKIIRYGFFGLISLIYVVSFAILFTNCELDLYTQITFSKRAQQIYNESPEDFVVYEMYPQVFMNYDGSVQIDCVVYSPTVNELEIGIKYNKKLIVDGNEPTFFLTDTNENSYNVCNVVSDTKGRYVYARISFEQVTLNLEENVYTNPDFSADAEGEGEAYDTLKFVLTIDYSDSKENEALSIFNSNTAIEIIDFKR